MAARYEPPKQGFVGQLFDIVVLLALVFGTLFLPIWLEIAVPSRVRVLPDGVGLEEQAAADGTITQVWSGLSWEAIGQNPTMQAQWEKLGYTLEGVADIVTQPFDYTIDLAGLAITAVVIIGYFVMLVLFSRKEYREVIAEKFE
jgi:hypothetical protein